MRLSIRTLLLTAPLWTLAACQTPSASSADMVPQDLVALKTIDGAVRIEAIGTGGMGWSERVSASNLRDAVRQGVLSSGLFTAVANEGPADWILAVSVAEVSDPEPDLFPEVEATLVWRLSDGTGDRIFWEHTVQSEGEADPQDHLDYVQREAIATGRAIAANLAEGLEALSKLDLVR